MAPRLFSCFGASKGNKATADEAAAAEEQRGVGGNSGVVVELFSSQGCTTSPEAELLMSRLGRGDFNLDIPIIVLAFHVDYWDYMGWKDPYGSSQWTVRQKAYVESLNLDTMFTPQAVIQGRAQCVGNEEEALLSAILDAPRFPSPTFQATFQKPSPDTLQVSLTGALRSKIDHQGIDIIVALFENGLVSECPNGENKGRMLSNDFVVRSFEKMCSVQDISAKKTISGTLEFPLWQGFNPNKCGIAVFTQNSSHHIFASQSFHLPENL